MQQQQQSPVVNLPEALNLLCPAVLNNHDGDVQESSSSSSPSTGTAANIPFEMERALACWVLLTRLSDDDEEELQKAWERHGTILQRFAIDILLKKNEKDMKNDADADDQDQRDVDMLQRYLRLVSQVTSRLTPELYPVDLGEAILQVWNQLCTIIPGANIHNGGEDADAPIRLLSVHMDVCASLEVFLLADPVRANVASVLPIIWNRFLHSCKAEAAAEATNTKNNTTASSSASPPPPPPPPPPSDEGEDPSKKGVMNDDGEDNRDWNMMRDTLDGILAPDKNPDCHYYSWTAWNELILGIFTQEGTEDLIPAAMVPSLLEWITSDPSQKSLMGGKNLRSAWNEWCLTWITTRSILQHASSPNKNPANSLFHQALLRDPDSISRLQRMLMSHVISPGASSNNKGDESVSRAMAWQALVALVDVNGFEWMILKDTATTTVTPLPTTAAKLGRATLLCTWIRLASGELRIQLQQLVAASTTPEEQQKHQPKLSASSVHSTGARQATGLPIGLACGRLLQSVVQYLIALADQPHIQMPLSGDALLHLRQSLEQTLWTAVEYLSLTTNTNTTTMSTSSLLPSMMDTTLHDDRASLFHSMLRLLGTLLMEVDIFDLLEKNHPPLMLENDDDGNWDHVTSSSSPSSSPVVILTCLQGMLPIAEDPSLLPGLVHILGDAEGDQDKEVLLLEYLYDPLLEYLEWYWQRGSTTMTSTTGRNNPTISLLLLDDTVAWACSSTELWVQLSVTAEQHNYKGRRAGTTNNSAAQPQQQRRRLCLALLTWIQQILQTSNPASRNYLALALGCYMTLSKDRMEPPKEHENRVILRALQWCEIG